MNTLTLLVLGTIAVALVAHFGHKAILPKPLPGIPYNENAAKQWKGDVPEMFGVAERRKWLIEHPGRHGAPLSQVLTPFRRPFIMLSDYDTIHEMLSKRWKDFDRGNSGSEFFGPYAAPTFHLVMNTSDPRFRQHRELLRDLMMPDFLHKIAAPRVYENLQTWITAWKLKQEKSDERPFEAGTDVLNHFMDSIRSVAFGLEDSSNVTLCGIEKIRQQSPGVDEYGAAKFASADVLVDAAAIQDIAEIATGGMTSLWPMIYHTKRILQPQSIKAWLTRKTMIDTQTDKGLKRLAEEGADARNSALDQVLWREMNASKKHGHKPDFYSPAIRHEMLGFLLAGHDTTATATMWWTRLMTKHQGVQKRLRKELREAHDRAVQEKRQPTTEELVSASIPYLEAVIHETLRHETPVHLITRVAMVDTELMGYPIPKGTHIRAALKGPGTSQPVNPGADAQRLKADGKIDKSGRWDESDIEDFVPDRWLKVDEKGQEYFDSKAGPMLTFSAGPRACWGRKLAIMHFKMLVSLMLWNFEFLPIEGQLGKMDRREEFTTKPKYTYVKLRQL